MGKGLILCKIPRVAGKSGDITGGLPRVTELFEARNPSNPAVVSEVDGIVSYGKIKRGNREIIVEARTGDKFKYMVPLSKHILVQDNDFVKAGMPLSDGAVTPNDILNIMGPTAVQEYIVNEIQDVYRFQGVKINDKHFEVIVRQMMKKVVIEDGGDTQFLEKQIIEKADFLNENDRMFGMVVVTDAGGSETLKVGQMVSARRMRDENSSLVRRDLAQGGKPRCHSSHLASIAPRHHARLFADEVLHLGRVLPGNDQGVERGCSERQARPLARLEGKRDCGPLDSCRNGYPSILRLEGRLQRGIRCTRGARFK